MRLSRRRHETLLTALLQLQKLLVVRSGTSQEHQKLRRHGLDGHRRHGGAGRQSVPSGARSLVTEAALATLLRIPRLALLQQLLQIDQRYVAERHGEDRPRAGSATQRASDGPHDRPSGKGARAAGAEVRRGHAVRTRGWRRRRPRAEHGSLTNAIQVRKKTTGKLYKLETAVNSR